LAWWLRPKIAPIFYKSGGFLLFQAVVWGQDEVMLPPALHAVSETMATVPHVMFCVKSEDGRYLAANRAFAERSGKSGAGEVIGCSAFDLFPTALAERYVAQDELVLRTGKVLSNQLEVITRPNGTFGWYLSSKSVWTDGVSASRGLVSVSVDLRTPVDAAAPHGRLVAAVELARRSFAQNPSVGELADAAEMSISQLERTTRRILGISPKQLVLRFRLEEALGLLTTTDLSVGAIAAECGYYDQSAFTRQFKRVTGSTPSAYRSS